VFPVRQHRVTEGGGVMAKKAKKSKKDSKSKKSGKKK
jgi:hypothetical protein